MYKLYMRLYDAYMVDGRFPLLEKISGETMTEDMVRMYHVYFERASKNKDLDYFEAHEVPTETEISK